MPPATSDTGALNTAHVHAANADDYMAKGLLIPASEEHYKAAQAFQICVDQSHDESAKRTLRMLVNEHNKVARETQRKIEKLREEGKDPALPRVPFKPPPSRNSTSNRAASPYSATGSRPPVTSPDQSRVNRLVDSGDTVEESFMVLGQQSTHDPGDAFNQFWKRLQDVEGILETFDRPLAFATTPLETPSSSKPTKPLGREGSSSSDTDFEDPMAATRARMTQRRLGRSTAAKSSATTFPPPKQPSHAVDLRDDLEEVFIDDDDDLAESFCLIPSTSESPPASPAVLLRKENAQLKEDLTRVQKQLEAAERIMKMRREQDAQLRESMMMARKEAQRAMASSMMAQRTAQPLIPGQVPDISPLNINLPPMPQGIPGPGGRDREAGLVKRVRELEEEVRVLKSENEKQKAMITRFRERWEKLKESAKRKKQAKSATAAVGDRIDEDPEAEERAEEQEKGEREQIGMGSAVTT
ncbi:hypothetical protein PUNSTDRAFT_123217 [Punctularia strigosozonata HHB-11173 SS5]|uniref:MIT domain-containing protein n=1 Tax=Punctularia strigosozonata (strain HHB-11173) TaxID=741275 RepID=R7S060_PUNST|nr:uncharacterized protein PUNSTDRAFT_123217 [Punctularia strigosozonata HHB-11173 SS5]EIN03628.1 hypothetical protein PUNSTDRAFT_123217 [Punctularia strigosozonata HHB-11173 SS5]